MKPKLLIITDSLGLPRENPEKVELDQTWVTLLSKKFDIYRFSLGGGTIDQLHSQLAYLKLYYPDFVIVQSGIVDCAPRALNKLELEIVKKSKFLSKIFGNSKVKKFFRKYRGVSYVGLQNFSYFVSLFKKEFGDNLFWVGIMPANEKYVNILPGIKRKIEEYNNILMGHLRNNYIETSDFEASFLMTDNIHLNVKGHRKLAEKIILKINLKNQNKLIQK